MALKLFNSLDRINEDFRPLSLNEVNLYSCGPTVHDRVHIGNLRAFLLGDILKRTLDFLGYDVHWVMNITDIDDKTIAKTIAEFGPEAGVNELKKFTDRYTEIFLDDLKKVNIQQSDIDFVEATSRVADIQEFIERLIEKGIAYKADDGSTYFSIAKYQEIVGDYGRLVGEKFLEGKKIGARVNSDEYEKENLSDFALWKATAADDGKISWNHPNLGEGRPGWHIECTLINYYKFPHGTDIHTGGIDLIFPHHTNEIAQAQSLYKPFVNYWLHNEHILVDEKKMAKSAKNFWTLEDLEKENLASGLSLRFLFLQSHYRSKLNVTKESLVAAQNGLNNLRRKIADLGEANNRVLPDEKFLETFRSALENDLNTPEAFAVIEKVLSSDLSNHAKLSTIYRFDEVLGLDLDQVQVETPAEVQALLKEHQEARKNKDFAKSDELRAKIKELGFEVLDSEDSSKVKPIFK